MADNSAEETSKDFFKEININFLLNYEDDASDELKEWKNPNKPKFDLSKS